MTQKNEASTKTISVIILSASYYEMFNLNGVICCILVHMNVIYFYVIFFSFDS